MISSAAHNSHPFFRFKSEEFASCPIVTDTETVSAVEKTEYLDSSKSHPQKLTGRWVSTGKPYPKMELQWTMIEPHQEEFEFNR